MENQTKTVSVIVPVGNGARFLEQAIASISIGDMAKLEVFIVDDASTDTTPDIVDRLTRQYPHIGGCRLDRNVGPGPARNIGLQAAEGEHIAFLDADDCYARDGLSYMNTRLETNPEVDVVMGRVKALRSTDGSQDPEKFVVEGASTRIFQLGSCLIRRSLLARIGAFDERYRHGEDIDWFFRAQEADARFDLIDRVVLHHRRHGSNFSDEQDGALDLATVMRESLIRRRKLAAQRQVPIDQIYYVRPDVMRMDD